MDEFFKMDVFFVVSTVVTIVVGGLFAVALWKFLELLKVLKEIADKAGKEAGALAEDIAEVRGAFKRDGLRLAALFEVMIGGAARLFSGKKKKRS